MAKKPKKRATQSPAARARELKREMRKKFEREEASGGIDICMSKALWVGRLNCGVES